MEGSEELVFRVEIPNTLRRLLYSTRTQTIKTKKTGILTRPFYHNVSLNFCLLAPALS